MDTLELARKIVDILEDKKGEDIVLLDIHEVSDFTDYFVICSATSDRMLKALADGVIEEIRNKHKIHAKIEGFPQEGWLLVDYGDVVVQLFSVDRREYYSLENLWEEGNVLLHLQ